MKYKIFLSALLLSWPVFSNADELKDFIPGTEEIINYKNYGSFTGIGTEFYSYKITDREGLAKASGMGVFPNTTALRTNEFRSLLRAKKLEGSHWNYIDTRNDKINFYKWVSAQENPGVKQYYIALMFERLGMLKEAIKAYYAVVVHYPKTHGMTYWQTVWYMGPNAIDKINFITAKHPELGLKLENAEIKVINSYDLTTSNDKFIVNPGKLVKTKDVELKINKVNMDKQKIVYSTNGKNVKLALYDNGHWQLLVSSRPYIIKGIDYSPSKVGLSPDRGTLNANRDWQTADYNKNGLIDGPYEAWVDENYNNKQDKNEPTVGDFALLKEMGCNTLRIYDHVTNKELFRDLYNKYGIMCVIGDLIGVYATGSGASWSDGTDYENPQQQENMLQRVKQMVLENKDEPYTLFWVLGNENVYGVANNSDKKPEAYFKFVNRAAKMIHELDPDHPVAVCNGDLKFLDVFSQNCPDVDIFGANAYRGIYGFGKAFFQSVKDLTSKPVIVTEYGCSAIGEGFTDKEAQEFQKEYFKYNWRDLLYNSAGYGVGNSLGGFAFEFVDEWWKANADMPMRIQIQKKEWYDKRSATYKNLQPENQDKVPQFGAPFIDGWSYEEWYGIFSQGNGKNSPYMRQKRPVYDMFKQEWNNGK